MRPSEADRRQENAKRLLAEWANASPEKRKRIMERHNEALDREVRGVFRFVLLVGIAGAVLSWMVAR